MGRYDLATTIFQFLQAQKERITVFVVHASRRKFAVLWFLPALVVLLLATSVYTLPMVGICSPAPNEKAKQLERALLLFEEMQRRGLEPGVIAINAAISKFALLLNSGALPAWFKREG